MAPWSTAAGVQGIALRIGLDFQPGAYAGTRELVELSEVAAEYDAILAAHVRYNDLGRFRVRDRGLLQEGYGAGMVIFDPETIADRATWEEPRLELVEIDRIVNGQVVVADGVPIGALPGRSLRR